MGDMSDLVNSMKLAQKYNNTTVEGEYRKGMLSSAHILAMDAKNLLDVVDGIRINYPSVDQMINTQSHSKLQPPARRNIETTTASVLFTPAEAVLWSTLVHP